MDLVDWQALDHQDAGVRNVVFSGWTPAPSPAPFCGIGNGGVPVSNASFCLAFVLKRSVCRILQCAFAHNAGLCFSVLTDLG